MSLKSLTAYTIQLEPVHHSLFTMTDSPQSVGGTFMMDSDWAEFQIDFGNTTFKVDPDNPPTDQVAILPKSVYFKKGTYRQAVVA